jgi:hypothetical protein
LKKILGAVFEARRLPRRFAVVLATENGRHDVFEGQKSIVRCCYRKEQGADNSNNVVTLLQVGRSRDDAM